MRFVRPTSSPASRSRTLRAVGLLLAATGAAVSVVGVLHAEGALRPSAVGEPTTPPVVVQPSTPMTSDTVTATPAITDDTVTVQYPLPSGVVARSVIPAEVIAAARTSTGLDGAVLARAVDPALLGVVRPPANARFRIVDHEVTIVPSRLGYRVTDATLAADVASVLDQTGDSRTVTLRPQPITPAFTTEHARALGVSELVASYHQAFPAARYRSVNIGRAARYISGTLLMPGQEFSMNATIRERTVANGYTEGWIIGPDGVFTLALGGAVSTITTAMYNAAWFAGVEFLEHRAHSIYIPRYPPGREATVSWGSFDMRFRNSLQHALFITVQVHPTSVDVFFWGLREWDRIGTIFGPWTDRVAYRTIRSAEPGCVPQDGMIGFRITTWRTFFRGGAEVRREQFTTRYQPSPRVLCVPRPSTSTATATPSATETSTSTATPTATPTPTAVDSAPAAA